MHAWKCHEVRMALICNDLQRSCRERTNKLLECVYCNVSASGDFLSQQRAGPSNQPRGSDCKFKKVAALTVH